MKLQSAIALFVIGLWSSAAPADDVAMDCPRTLGSTKVFSEPWPQADTWYGSESLAVILPEDGVWPTTQSGALIAVKLFWWSVGFEPGLEDNLKVQVERLDQGENDTKVSTPTNAHSESFGGWTMLTGIDFKSEGCWQFTAEYFGQSLQFVVETSE